MTDSEKLQFVCDFMLRDFDEMRKGDWSNLLEDFEKYFEPTAKLTLETLSKLSRQAAKSLARESAMLVFNYLRVREWLRLSGAAEDPEGAKRRLEIIANLESTGLIQTDRNFSAKLAYEMSIPQPGKLLVAGKARDLFLFDLYRLLESPEAGKLQVCPYCRMVPFFRIGRQVYCSRQHAAAAAKRAYLERQAHG